MYKCTTIYKKATSSHTLTINPFLIIFLLEELGMEKYFLEAPQATSNLFKKQALSKP
jgi:hypothetical protein